MNEVICRVGGLLTALHGGKPDHHGIAAQFSLDTPLGEHILYRINLRKIGLLVGKGG